MHQPSHAGAPSAPGAYTPAPADPTVNKWGVKTIHTKMIDGRQYTTVMHGAEVAFEHLVVLTDIAAGPSTVALDTLRVLFVDGLHAAAPTPMTLGDGLRALAAAIHKAGGSQFVRSILDQTTVVQVVQGQQVHGSCRNDFSTLYQGNLIHMFNVLAWVLEVNYLPFLLAATPGGSSPLQRFKERLNSVLPGLWPASTSNPASGSGSESPEDGESAPDLSSETGASTKSSTPTKSSTLRKRRKSSPTK